MSEGEAIYMDKNHGMFSKSLAEWAISNMEVKDPATKEVKSLKEHSIEEMESVLKQYKVELPEEFIYTAWYLYNMTFADYPKTIKTDEQRAMYIEETLCDVDGSPENVLNCFVAKMCEAEVPIWWEKYL